MSVLSIYCADDEHERCDGWFVLWPCACPCHLDVEHEVPA